MKKQWFIPFLLLSLIFLLGATWYTWRYRTHATDCTSLTDGRLRDLCFEEDDNTLYKCEAADGLCDTAGEWTVIIPNDAYFKLGGDVATAGTYDFGSASVVLEIPNAAAPTTDATGKIAIDTDLITQGMLQVYLTSALCNVVATTDTPADNEIPKYDSASGTITWEADAGAGGGATYREITLLPESSVLDDNNPPAITVVESTGTGTPRFRVANFDASTDEIIYWTFVLPSDYTASSSPIVDVYWYSDDTGANETCAWGIQVSATTEADTDDMLEQACDADVLVVTEDVNTTEATRLMKTSGTLTYATYMDGAAAGDVITIRFFRDVSADDLSSDASLHSVHIKIPRS